MRPPISTAIATTTAAILAGTLFPPAATAAPHAVIVFERYTPSQPIEDVHAVKPTGGAIGDLTNSPAISDVQPAVAPGGHPIALARSGPGIDGIWTMQADGSALAQVPNTQGGTSPAWSPDGEKIAFTKGWGSQSELFVINGDGNNLQQVTLNAVGDHAPVWSPDGHSLAFARTNAAESASAIVVLNLGTGQLSQVTGYSHLDSAPDWSPENMLVFSRYLGAGDSDLYLVRPDGSGLQQLTTGPLQDNHPDFSPDGSSVAFARGGADETDHSHLFRVRVKNGHVKQVTFGAVFDFFPSWA